MPATYEMLKFEKQNKRGDAEYNEAFYFHSEWNIMVKNMVVQFLCYRSTLKTVPGEALKHGP